MQIIVLFLPFLLRISQNCCTFARKFGSIRVKNAKNLVFLLKYFAIQKKSIIFAADLVMKYNELHKKLKKFGCYPTGNSIAGHPEWYSPITGKYFPTSNHGSQEVASGTLRSIIRDSGIA